MIWLLRALLGVLLEPSCADLGASWAVLRPSWAVLGPSWAVMEVSCAIVEASWAVLAALGSFGRSWGDLRGS